MDFDKKKILRICDANCNRAKEGLRVVEEYIRFYLNDAILLDEIRKIRHDLGLAITDIYQDLIKERDIFSDKGLDFKEKDRDTLKSMIIANSKRAQEAMRVLEEYSKLLFYEKASIFKNLRFQMYDLEKQIYFE
ncbi:thiamine-phosphate pyrophosphorylase [bacterium]